MAERSIEQRIITAVAQQMGVEESDVGRDTHFVNDLGADSPDLVEIVMELEDEFELSIPDAEAEKVQTVGQAIDYVKAALAEA